VTDDERWYGVRCVFVHAWPAGEHERTYEERVTLWRAPSFDAAIELAEAEAADYCDVLTATTYLGAAQAYWLSDEPGHGAEVFSLMRDSALPPETYLDTFFTTGSERQHRL